MTTHSIRIGLLFGGMSGEHEVSIQSARSIHQALDPERYQVFPIGIGHDGIWRLGSSSAVYVDADDVATARISADAVPVMAVPGAGDGATSIRTLDSAREVARIDVFFPIVHGTFGEDGSIQGLLRMLGAAHVGPGLTSSAVAMDKDVSKRILRDAGLPIARHRTLRNADELRYDEAASELGSVLFIKPANLGSSVGIHRVDTQAAFERAVDDALRYDRKVIVEEYVNAREIECAVLGNDEPVSSRPGEVRPRSDFYSYEAKYVDAHGAELIVPASLDEPEVERLRATAVAAYRALECEGMARVDLFLCDDGSILVNEINTLPGFTSISMYPKLWEVSGLPYRRLLDRLVDLALERHAADQRLIRRFDTKSAGISGAAGNDPAPCPPA